MNEKFIVGIIKKKKIKNQVFKKQFVGWLDIADIVLDCLGLKNNKVWVQRLLFFTETYNFFTVLIIQEFNEQDKKLFSPTPRVYLPLHLFTVCYIRSILHLLTFCYISR